MENLTFYEQINLFLKNKGQGTLGCTHTRICIHKTDACVRRHGPANATRVPENYERQVLCIKVKV